MKRRFDMSITPKKFDTVVYIGRFQPVHNAHVATIRRAAAIANHVIVVIGSADQPRTYKNPFSVDERKIMLDESVLNSVREMSEVSVVSVRDSRYNNQAWVSQVQSLVNAHTSPDEKVGIIGHQKDGSSFYLKMFPQWEHVEVELLEPLHASDIRDLYFKQDPFLRYLDAVVPASVMYFLNEFRKKESFNQIVAEREFVKTYKQQFEGLKYAPTFITTDAVVMCSGHILMIERKAEPGRGLFALPGGFLNADTDKSLVDACIRELREETGIKVPGPVLRGRIQDKEVFDAIDRSARGRTVTHAFKIVLQDGELPHVKGGDDAAKAFWVPFADITPAQCFEDHYDLIQWAIGKGY